MIAALKHHHGLIDVLRYAATGKSKSSPTTSARQKRKASDCQRTFHYRDAIWIDIKDIFKWKNGSARRLLKPWR